jgi:putative PIN family toxin of toxin-antitoxin system
MIRNKRNLSVVVDTNVFVSGLIVEKGLPHQLIKLLEEDLFILIISQKMRDELEEVLYRVKFSAFLSKDKLYKFFRMIDIISTVVSPRAIIPVEVRDPKDQKVLATALGGKADYLVTGDKDLIVLKDTDKLGGLKIVGVKEFLKLLE